MKIKLDSNYNPKHLTLVLAQKDGTKLGILPAYHLKFNGEFNSYCTAEFSIYKNVDGQSIAIWDEIKDFRLLWIKEFDLWFEIHVQVGDGNVRMKNVTAKSLAEAELSQVNLYGMEVNTEPDILRDDYRPTVFYDNVDTSSSLLNRVLTKVPHYSVLSVPVSLRNIQRSFSWDGTSIYDALHEISEEIGCYFDLAVHSDENGKPNRTIRVYDLESYCTECRTRGEFSKVCNNCGSQNIVKGYGDDMGIFVSTSNLTDEITFETNEDSVKNCFKLEAGDDLMTAAVVSCNPNGSSYLWYIPQFMRDDMPTELVEQLEKYDVLSSYYQNDHVTSLSSSLVAGYNYLVNKYRIYDSDLTEISASLTGFPSLMNAFYDTIDFSLLLQSSLMPSIETMDTSANAQAMRLTSSRLSPVAVYSLDSASASTVNSYVLAMAKAQIDSRYQVKIISSSYSGSTWTGSFSVTNYYDEEDSANSGVVSINIVDNYQSYVSQMLDKSLSNTTDFATDIVSLFELADVEFKEELQKYSLSRLTAFHDSCEACLNILIEQGAANSSTWNTSNEDLYADLYVPYRAKQRYISDEIRVREAEIQTITDLQNEIIEYRNQIQESLNFETYLGTDLWLKFVAYRREDTYSNSNYISDGLNNAELFDRALQFIEVANQDLYRSANLQHTLTSTLKNFLIMKEFAPLVDKFELGNYIHIQCDDDVYTVRLLSYEIDFDNLGELNVTFSDARSVGSDISDIQDVLDNSKSMSSSYDNVAHQAEKGKNSRDQLDNWTANGLSLTAMKIINSADNQDYVFDSHGMLFRKYQPLLGTYGDEQLKIVNSTIAITNDNWETVKTAIGSYYYVDPITQKVVYTYGINGETLIGKIILGEHLGIYNSGSSLSFTYDGLSVDNGVNRFNVNPNSDKLLSVSKIDPNGTALSDIMYLDDQGNLHIAGTIDGGDINIGNGNFVVDKSGHLTAKSGIFMGTVQASEYRDMNGNLMMSEGKFKSGYLDLKGITVKNSDGEITFKVTQDGEVSIAGDVTLGSDVTISWDNVTGKDSVINGIDNALNIAASAHTNANNASEKAEEASEKAEEASDIISGWKYGGTTFIDGSQIWTGTVTASTLRGGEIALIGEDKYGDPIKVGSMTLTDASTAGYAVDLTSGGALRLKSTEGSIFLGTWDDYYDTWEGFLQIDKYGSTIIGGALYPASDNDYLLGLDERRWADIYAVNSTISSSDMRQKQKITYDLNNYEIFYNSLKPISYQFVVNQSNRTHIGFGSQDVERALIDSGLSSKDFAGFIKSPVAEPDGVEDHIYGLRYGEFIALNTWQIQKLKARVDELENLIKNMNK